MAKSTDKPDGDIALAPKTKPPAPPKRFKAILHNDNYTTMDFVVDVLMNVFGKSTDEAVQVMLSVHQHGHGVAGVYPLAVAETKARTTSDLAQAEGFPLRCSVEPE